MYNIENRGGGIKMSNKIFTEKEIKKLSHNKNVKTISINGITYSDEFKHIFIEENEKGKPTREIFEEHGFDLDTLGMDRVRSSGKRWRAAYRKKGILGLADTRKENSGRPSDKELSIEQKFELLKVQINFLKAENELLKKIDILERRLISKK